MWRSRLSMARIGHGVEVTRNANGRHALQDVEQLEGRDPQSPTDLTKRSWRYVARRTAREFLDDQCTDLAAGLTYYAVLATFPGIIALLSLVGLVGQGQETVDTLLDILRQVGAGQIASTLEEPLNSLAQAERAAGFAFVLGLAIALFSASGYVGSFGRSMNRIYEIREGRPFWKLRPLMMLVTLIALLLAAVVALALIISGPAAEAIGNALGLGSTVVTVWNIAKWPVIAAAVVLVVAILYWATPNVQQPKFRWLSVGALLAIVVWVLASVGFGIYVANFSSYNKTYGTLAGFVVFLLWLWITNLALLFGAELDAELERGRELQAGIPAEETVQLPPRDTRNIQKAQAKEQEDIARGRQIREAHRDEGPQDQHPDRADNRGGEQ
jgi:membrane protein